MTSYFSAHCDKCSDRSSKHHSVSHVFLPFSSAHVRNVVCHHDRFRTARDIPLKYFKQRKTIYTKVMTVNDADNLRVMHIPFAFRLLPIPLWSKRLELSEQTINVRLAGIDSPEGPHFGKPGQPYFEESKNFLTSLVANRHVYCRIHRLDQYHRAVGERHPFTSCYVLHSRIQSDHDSCPYSCPCLCPCPRFARFISTNGAFFEKTCPWKWSRLA